MASKQSDARRFRWRPWVLPTLVLTFVSIAGLVVFQQVEAFLIRDGRFQVRRGVLPGEDSPDLRISGINRTPAAQVRRVFAPDEGRSLYLVPLEERREALLAIDWVRNASVNRVWPNRVDVRIQERHPVAAARIPGAFRGSPSTIVLVDSEGVLLPVPAEGFNMDLPALAGLRQNQTPEERAARVRRMTEIAGELGEMAAHVSEFDLTDLSNIRLVYQAGDRAYTLLVGDKGFADKVQRFVQYVPEISRRSPDAVAIDLRLGDRITAINEEAHGQ